MSDEAKTALCEKIAKRIEREIQMIQMLMRFAGPETLERFGIRIETYRRAAAIARAGGDYEVEETDE